MRFVPNILLVVLLLALPVAVHGASDVSMDSDASTAQSVVKTVMSEPDHDDPCASLGPNCQSEASTCMMDCCLMIALNPVSVHMLHRTYSQGIWNRTLAAIDLKASFRPPIV